MDWVLTLLGQALITIAFLLPLVKAMPRAQFLPIALAIGAGLLLVDEFAAAFGQPGQLVAAALFAGLGWLLAVLIGRMRDQADNHRQ
ncbi:hypothetical protein NLX83_18035 [Allokutzneria sp. A3M-2-11 16]|uniref:hypothetical protein n=1 Tax=Allokutzneria sp. A3M-2-11 16 TaxID=2962043 RepID=UPI0020B6E1C2|nr:hypothetical protein [Allokutzneria sp. A3M-2-11 16]MCP3801163.1 hypothetical protein [Allokutzneria sp. A3M-2-11 16]